MSSKEQVLEQERAVLARNLTPGTAHRIILRMTSFAMDPKTQASLPLTEDAAGHFGRALHAADQRHPDFTLVARDGSYFVDFATETSDDPRSTLRQVVDRTDSALIETMLPAAIVGAWIAEPTAPDMGHLGMAELGQLPSITQSAQEMAERHRQDVSGDFFQRLLFEA